jgi:predicted DNA-binding transcriptional regulator AlpA
MDEPSIFLRPRAAAAFLNLSSSTLAKLRLRGDGPVFSKLGRAVVYDREDLKAWAHARRRFSTSETCPTSDSSESAR